MRELLILGTGVHGAEMAEIVERINRERPTWNLLGFVSAHPSNGGALHNEYPVVGSIDALAQFTNAWLIADNEWPRSLPVPHERLVSLMDPSAFISRTARIGVGCVVYPHCFVGVNARIGDDVFCLSGTIINHDDVIEDRVVFASGVTVAGQVHIETDCYLGQSCTIRQLLRIGRGSLIGMGFVIVKDVPPGSVVVGNPARKLRTKDVE